MKAGFIVFLVGYSLVLQAQHHPGQQKPLPIIDLSSDSSRQVIVAQGTKETYQGHPTTTLLPDGKTMFCVWTINHGGPCGPIKRSDDGGLSWSELLPVPKSWAQVSNCPTIFQLPDPRGKTRIFVFAGESADANVMQQSYSADNGKTWTEMKSNGLPCVMPFCTIESIDKGKKLLGLTNIRRPGETKENKSNIVTQSISTDGGFTWSGWKVIADSAGLKLCEPYLVRSPSGKQLLCLMRENATRESYYITSDNEGKTWSSLKKLPAGLYGDRHVAKYTRDGRLVVVFRDTGADSPIKPHFVAWVGTYDDIIRGKDGQYKVKLLHSYSGTDNGYPGLELLPDDTFVATTYIKYRPGPEKHSVVSTRFKIAETDKMLK